jgi:hypothetical protein
MRFATVVLGVLLTGCATTYQPQGFSGGFAETQLDTNVFRVSFRGNGYTSAERAEEMALLRSAEVAIKNSFTHFAVVDGASRSRYSTVTTPTQSTTTGTVSVNGNTAFGTARTTTSGGQSFVIAKPSTTNTIVCFVGKPDVAGLVYDARFLMNSLGAKYGVSVPAIASPPAAAVEPRLATAVAPASMTTTRPIALRWDGYASLVSGTLSLVDGATRGSINAALPGGDGQCTGAFEYTAANAGNWSVLCSNGMSATGTFEAFGRGKGSAGKGKDLKGNTVEFTVGAGPA